MNAVENHTCVIFLPRNDEDDFIEITDGASCSSKTGMIGGQQEVSLSRKAGCLKKHKMQRELIRTLGFAYMHTCFDRDNFIKVIDANVKPDQKASFAKVNAKDFEYYGTSYDLNR